MCWGNLGRFIINYKWVLSPFYPHSKVKTQIPNGKSKIQNPLLFQNSFKTPLESKLKLKLEDGFSSDFFSNVMGLQSIRCGYSLFLNNLSFKEFYLCFSKVIQRPKFPIFNLSMGSLPNDFISHYDDE